MAEASRLEAFRKEREIMFQIQQREIRSTLFPISGFGAQGSTGEKLVTT